MSEISAALYLPSSRALTEAVTSLPEQLDDSVDFRNGSLHFIAKGKKGPVLPSVEAKYVFIEKLQQFQVTGVALDRGPNGQGELIRGEELSHALLSGGRPQEISVSLRIVPQDWENSQNSGKRIVQRFRDELLPELQKGYVMDQADLYGMSNTSSWRIRRLILLPRTVTPVQWTSFSLTVGRRESRTWLGAFFNATKDKPYYNFAFHAQQCN